MSETTPPADPRVGLTVTHSRYVPYSHAHYAGDLVDGARVEGRDAKGCRSGARRR